MDRPKGRPGMILERHQEVRDRIAAAAARRGRKPEDVELVAVTKYAALEDVRALLDRGLVRQCGESRVQDALRRRESLGPAAGGVVWRFIGHLQTNKAAAALASFDWLDSLDSARLAEALQHRLAGTGRVLPVLVQVKLTERETQSGVAPEQVPGFLESLKAYPNLRVRGLMAIAPNLEPVEAVRPHFRRLRRLFEDCFPEPSGGEKPLLSMGMSRDYEIAVEEGADLVRVGSALFG